MAGTLLPFDPVREGAGQGALRVEVLMATCGEDVVIVLSGGTHPHVGAVALAQPRPSLADPATISASASVLCVVGHKEDELARRWALHLAAAWNRRVTVTAGIHLNDGTAGDIAAVLANCEQLLARLTERLPPIASPG